MSEFRESEHPRDDEGKFTAKGSGGFRQNTSYAEIMKDKADGGENRGKDNLTINSPAAMEIYSRIVSGDYLSIEELRQHPAVKEMDRLADAYISKYGDTSLIDRDEQRHEWVQEFLSMGSAVEISKNARGRAVYEFVGEIKREHKVVIVIGLPASGKSTLIANPVSEKIGAFIFDSDEVKKLIPEFKETNGAAAGAVHQESKNILETAKQQFLQGKRSGENLIIPVIGHNLDKLQNEWIRPFEDAGYDVEVKYQDSNPVESANRVIMRAIKVGRVIPSKEVLKYGDKPKAVYEALKSMKGKGGKPYVRN